MARKNNRYYVIKKGKETGIFEKDWYEIEHLVNGFKGAVYKGFRYLREAEKFMSEPLPDTPDRPKAKKTSKHTARKYQRSEANLAAGDLPDWW